VNHITLIPDYLGSLTTDKYEIVGKDRAHILYAFRNSHKDIVKLVSNYPINKLSTEDLENLVEELKD
jgi:hypothetical protein